MPIPVDRSPKFTVSGARPGTDVPGDHSNRQTTDRSSDRDRLSGDRGIASGCVADRQLDSDTPAAG